MSLSIIFPAFEEQDKIASDIKRADQYLAYNHIIGEIIVVNDGSSDNTYKNAVKLTNHISTELKVLNHEKNIGKGAAVKTGVLYASKDFILYSDVGGIVPFNNMDGLMERMQSANIDILHGSRKLSNSNITKEQDWDRKIASWLFNKFVRLFFDIPQNLTDTQCGFKIYKKEVGQKLFSNLLNSGFLFEIEIILKAQKNKFKIVEIPVEWKCDRDSRINFWNTMPNVLKEIFRIKRMF